MRSQIHANICEHLHVEILDKYLRETNCSRAKTDSSSIRRIYIVICFHRARTNANEQRIFFDVPTSPRTLSFPMILSMRFYQKNLFERIFASINNETKKRKILQELIHSQIFFRVIKIRDRTLKEWKEKLERYLEILSRKMKLNNKKRYNVFIDLNISFGMKASIDKLCGKIEMQRSRDENKSGDCERTRNRRQSFYTREYYACKVYHHCKSSPRSQRGCGRCSISKGHNSSISVLGGVNYRAWLVAHVFFTRANEGTVGST